jgi:SAM-dependent methyltransferase
MKKYFLSISLFLCFNYSTYVFGHGGSGGKEAEKTVNRASEIFAIIEQNEKTLSPPSASMIKDILPRTKLLNENIIKENVLEIGSRLGSVGDYLYKNGLQKVWGVDLDSEKVTVAKSRYSYLNFHVGDVLDLPDLFEEDFFSAVMLFDVASSIESDVEMIQKIKNVSKDEGLFIIADYVSLDKSKTHLTNMYGKEFKPLDLENYKSMLDFLGYEIMDVQDIAPDIKLWLAARQKKISEKEKYLLSQHFSQQEIDLVKHNLATFIQLINDNVISSKVIYAKNH